MSHTVLVVESEPWLGEHYESVLRAAGFNVLRTANGYSAIDIIDEKQPDAIVMSLMLDGPGAVGLLHELQSYSDTASVPVIVCSNLEQLNEEELRHYGVQRILDSRVMKLDEIPAAVRSVLS